MENEKQFSWFTDNRECQGVFNSIEDVISDAQNLYDKKLYPYINEDISNIISIGVVMYFDFKNATKNIAQNIEEYIYQELSDFTFSCDMECETYVKEDEKEKMIDETTNALLPIIKKYIFVNPIYICKPFIKYDLKNKTYKN